MERFLRVTPIPSLLPPPRLLLLGWLLLSSALATGPGGIGQALTHAAGHVEAAEGLREDPAVAAAWILASMRRPELLRAGPPLEHKRTTWPTSSLANDAAHEPQRATALASTSRAHEGPFAEVPDEAEKALASDTGRGLKIIPPKRRPLSSLERAAMSRERKKYRKLHGSEEGMDEAYQRTYRAPGAWRQAAEGNEAQIEVTGMETGARSKYDLSQGAPDTEHVRRLMYSRRYSRLHPDRRSEQNRRYYQKQVAAKKLEEQEAARARAEATASTSSPPQGRHGDDPATGEGHSGD